MHDICVSRKEARIDMKKVLIFGAAGRVGSRAVQGFLEGGWEVSSCVRGEVDLTDGDAVERRVAEDSAEAVVNCAAISSLEACVDDPLAAHLVNAVAPAMMARACAREGKRFIHLSTDYVLDGRRPGLKGEDAGCKPVCVYGESKREGELQVLEEYPDAVVARVSWVCGHPGKPGFAEAVARKALSGEPLAAVADKFSLPTDVDDVVRILLAMCERQVDGGVWHVCSSGEPMSWYGYASVVLEALAEMGFPEGKSVIVEQKLDEMLSFRDTRPRHTAMGNERLLQLGIRMPDAREAIRHAVLRYVHSRS